MAEERNPIMRIIPENYKGSIALLNFSLKMKFLAEGIIIGLGIGLVTAIILFSIPGIQFATRVGLSLAMAGAGLFVGCKGINDESVFTWVKNYKKFKARKRVTFFNPHIRQKNASFKEYQKTKDTLLKEQLIKIYEKVKGNYDKAEREKLIEFEKTSIYDISQMYFKDDESDVPIEYMNANERKAYLKAEKKRIKEAQRNARKAKRERRVEVSEEKEGI